MGNFSNINIGPRVFAGFGVVLVLLVVIAGLGWYGLIHAGNNLASYTNTAGDALLVTDLDAQMSGLRVRTNRYLHTGAVAELDAVRELVKVIDEILETAKVEIRKPERASLVAEIIEHKDAYLQSFRQLVALIERRNRSVEKLNGLGRDIRQSMTEIIEQSMAANDFKAAAFAGIAQEELMGARLYVAKFLDVNSTENAKRATDEFAAMKLAVAKLGANLGNARHRERLTKLTAKVDEYQAIFNELVETIGAHNTIVTDVMNVHGKAIAEKGALVQRSAQADEIALDAQSTAEITFGIWLLILCSAAVVALGAGIAWFIGRGIAGPVVGMTRAMGKLAEGDQTVEIPGLGRKDEIGAMAAAVDVFKRNAIDLELIQNEQFEQRSRMMEILGKMAHRMQGAENAEEFGNIIEKYAPQVLGDRPGALHQLTNSGNRLELLAKWNSTGDTIATFPMSDCWALRNGRPHIVENTNLDVLCRHVDAERVTSYRCIPLHAQGEVVGLFYVEGNEGTNTHDPLYNEIITRNTALALANLRLRKTLRNQSIRDPLTNLFNRRYLEESMDLEFARAERSQTAIGIVMIDIDHFKCYNDTYGHDGGDALLLAFTKLLTLTIRKGDLACRYGGEEFVLMLPGADACAVKRRAEVLSQAVALLAVAHGGRSLGPVTMSAGVAVYPEHGENPHSVLAAADEALLRAKANGRNRVETAPAPEMAASAVVADLDSRRIIKSIV